MGDCHAMALAFTGRSLTEEIWVRYQGSSLGIWDLWWIKLHWERIFSGHLSFSCVVLNSVAT